MPAINLESNPPVTSKPVIKETPGIVSVDIPTITLLIGLAYLSVAVLTNTTVTAKKSGGHHFHGHHPSLCQPFNPAPTVHIHQHVLSISSLCPPLPRMPTTTRCNQSGTNKTTNQDMVSVQLITSPQKEYDKHFPDKVG